MKGKMKIVFFFVIFFIIFSSHFYSQEIPELLVWIESSTKISLETLSAILESKVVSPRVLIDKMKERYNEVWAADKSQWPECIRKVFENLKKYEIIIIKWELVPRLRKPYYQGDYDANGKFVSDYTMNIINVYANKFHLSDFGIKEANLDKKRINPNMWFKTSGVLLHEMLHMALLRNQYTKEVRNDKGEVVDSYDYEPKVEDCTSYYENIHPAISAFYTWAGIGTVNSDGYFEEFGENFTVLLRRTKNRKPLAMIYYPFDDENSGAILVTSMFTDWGAAHGQSSKTETHLVRDFQSLILLRAALLGYMIQKA